MRCFFQGGQKFLLRFQFVSPSIPAIPTRPIRKFKPGDWNWNWNQQKFLEISWKVNCEQEALFSFKTNAGLPVLALVLRHRKMRNNFAIPSWKVWKTEDWKQFRTWSSFHKLVDDEKEWILLLNRNLCKNGISSLFCILASSTSLGLKFAALAEILV